MAQVKNQTKTPEQEYYDELQNQLDEFKKKLDDITDEEELKQLEADIIKEYEENDEHLKTVEYALQDGVKYDKKTYLKATVAKYICDMLNKLEIGWQMTLGMYQMYQLWQSVPEKLTYYELDSTLRTLDQLKFKGFQEWTKILVINEYFKYNHTEYSKDMAQMVFIANKHNAILDRIKLVTKTDIPEDVVLQDEMANMREI